MFKRFMAFLVSLFLTLSFTLNRAYTGINNPNNEITITQNRFASENEFISMKREKERLPSFKEERDNLPKPVWDGHDDFHAVPGAQQHRGRTEGGDPFRQTRYRRDLLE